MECPTREAVSGRDGLRDTMKNMADEADNFRDEMREALHKIDKRLSRIEWGFVFAVGRGHSSLKSYPRWSRWARQRQQHTRPKEN